MVSGVPERKNSAKVNCWPIQPEGPSVIFRICHNTGMSVWGRGGGGLTLPVSKKCKNEKKRKERRKEEEREKERELRGHDVRSKRPLCFTNGGRDLRTVRTHTSLQLFGGRGPGRCLEGSVPAKTGESKRANKTTPTRHRPVLPNAFGIDFTWGLLLSFPMFLEAQVRRATVTSSRRRTGVFNAASEGRAASLEKKTRVLQSFQGVKLWLASSQIY